jgi:para-nitrobenzyl esterase
MRRRCRLLVVAAMLGAPLASHVSPSELQVRIETGAVEGKEHGVRTFLGIPYAAPPVGDLRWKPPAHAASWTGVRKSTEFGARCMQGPIYSDMVFRDAGGSEDCLTLNVWTPAKDAQAKLPVMVWIHGGGFMAGGSSEPRQDGEVLAKRGVVVVSMNYRLGIFGFLVLPELAAGSDRKAAGNYGFLDQVAALEWVRRNIASFGGDPANVTVFGESAGSFSVSALMASPLAKGLFHRAIGESGAAFFSSGLPLAPLAVRAQEDSQFASASLRVPTLKEMRAIPAQRILDASLKERNGGRPRFAPDVDGYFLPALVPTIFAEGKQSDVPLLAGWNHDEGSGEIAHAPQLSAMDRMKIEAAKAFGTKAEEFLRLYPADSDAMAERSLEDFAGDRFIAWSTWKWLEAQTATGKQPIYRYRFDLAPPADPKDTPGLGAFHSAEIEYVFGMLESRASIPWRLADRNLSELMQEYWVNFARNGDPNGPGLPEWPVYRSASGSQVMYLSARPKAGKDDQRDRYLFLSAFWEK